MYSALLIQYHIKRTECYYAIPRAMELPTDVITDYQLCKLTLPKVSAQFSIVSIRSIYARRFDQSDVLALLLKLITFTLMVSGLAIKTSARDILHINGEADSQIQLTV